MLALGSRRLAAAARTVPLALVRRCASATAEGAAAERPTLMQRAREQLAPNRSILSMLVWRSVRIGRTGALAFALYQAGKASGHVDVLEDPDGLAKQIVKEVLAGSHFSSDGTKKPSWHKRSSPLHKRVQKIGEAVLQAARDEVAAQLEALPKKKEGVAEDAWVVEKREELKGAAQRLRGTWHWVVTNSDAPNAFVTPCAIWDRIQTAL